jgi:toxin CcdB
LISWAVCKFIQLCTLPPKHDKLRRRVVVPLVSWEDLNRTAVMPESAFNPIFVIEGVRVALNPLEIVSVPVEILTVKVASLTTESDAIISALDELLARARN